MRLSEIKGEEAFKTIGKLIGCLREMYDEETIKIATEQKTGWIFEFFQVTLEKKSDVWVRAYMILNPEIKKENISLGSVIKFAYDFKNDQELMSLFFSQSEQIVNSSSGSPTENTEETEAT